MNFDAFDLSPVPAPGPDAQDPGVYRGIYGMPMFVTVPTADLHASVDFWTDGLGFIDLFTIPGQLTHLRRWAFQDVLLVAGEPAADLPAATVGFACLLDQLDGIARACTALSPGSTDGPRVTPWNTTDLEIRTPENTRVNFTAAMQLDPDSETARNLRAVGFDVPSS
ncbi:MAG: VOC family protein [Rhodococcus sp.]|uniref:VOC family protein n=1 Tax=Rhodococcus TaxID=1827 RepID=UPI00169EDE44|nr:VOC family protein [Rhodococcus sp. (in: high G+C Gram-positive bacteria)]NLV78604.1 VOC family protein [Rhodococcus sp. (in: high G+C Gram-positive bacteria)]